MVKHSSRASASKMLKLLRVSLNLKIFNRRAVGSIFDILGINNCPQPEQTYDAHNWENAEFLNTITITLFCANISNLQNILNYLHIQKLYNI